MGHFDGDLTVRVCASFITYRCSIQIPMTTNFDNASHKKSPGKGTNKTLKCFNREIFYEEVRDWNWWENIRRFIFANSDSGYLTG